jgi:hypothetical protein
MAVVSSKVLEYTFDEGCTFSDTDKRVYPCLYTDEKDLLRHIDSRIKYPITLIEQNITGVAYACFTIQSNGVVSDIEILRSPDPLLDKELVRVLGVMAGTTIKTEKPGFAKLSMGKRPFSGSQFGMAI